MGRNKKLAILLIALLVVVLAGCGGGTGETGKTGPSGSETGVDAAELLTKGQNLPGLFYDSVVKAEGMDPVATQVWVKKGNMRIEMEIPESGGKMISIVNGLEGMVYSYSPGQGMATKMALTQSEVDTSSPQDYAESMEPQSMKFLKRESLDGKECVVYEVADPDYAGKAWIWKDYGIPLKVEAVSEGGSMVMEYQNVEVGELDDGLFELPNGVQVMDLGNFQLTPVNP